jgi:hypothetical protein
MILRSGEMPSGFVLEMSDYISWESYYRTHGSMARGDGVQVGTKVKRDCRLADRHFGKEAGIITTFLQHLKILNI